MQCCGAKKIRELGGRELAVEISVGRMLRAALSKTERRTMYPTTAQCGSIRREIEYADWGQRDLRRTFGFNPLLRKI